MPTDQIYPHHHEKLTNYFEMMYNGVPIMVEHDGGSTLRIDRILSTNPADYLTCRYSARFDYSNLCL